MTSELERDEDGSTPAVVLTVAAVARRLGVAPSTLRTWDRRYGLGPSAHTAGSHRRYSPSDVSRLVVMRGLVMQGVPPAEAAQIALGAPVESPPDPARSGVWAAALRGRRPGRPVPVSRGPLPDSGPVPADPGGLADRPPAPAAEGSGRTVWPVSPLAARHLLAAAEGGSAPRGPAMLTDGGPLEEFEAADEFDPVVAAAVGRDALLASVIDEALRASGPPARLPAAERGGRAGGGRVIALPDASPRARGLARAAMSLDTYELSRLLRDAVGSFGVIGAWNTMVLPVLKGLGDRWEATGDGVDVEHAFAEATAGVLRGVTALLHRPRNVRPVLLACAEGDHHSLPLHVLAAALSEVEIGCRMLGVGLPADSLVAAIRRTGPAATFIYARLPVVDASSLGELPRQRPAPRVFVGGPGWDGLEVPAQVTRVDSLRSAVDEVRAALEL